MGQRWSEQQSGLQGEHSSRIIGEHVGAELGSARRSRHHRALYQGLGDVILDVYIYTSIYVYRYVTI